MEYTTDSVSFPRRVAIPLAMGLVAKVSNIGTSCDTKYRRFGMEDDGVPPCNCALAAKSHGL